MFAIKMAEYSAKDWIQSLVSLSLTQTVKWNEDIAVAARHLFEVTAMH